MFTSLDSKRTRGDCLFPLAFQKYKIVDTRINMEGRKKKTRAHNENDWKVDFLL